MSKSPAVMAVLVANGRNSLLVIVDLDNESLLIAGVFSVCAECIQLVGRCEINFLVFRFTTLKEDSIRLLLLGELCE